MEKKIYWLKKQGESGNYDYIDQDGVSHNSPNGWLWDFLGGCGCGSSEQLESRARKIFDNFATKHMSREFSIYDDLTNETLAHWMDSVGLLEHGSGIAGSGLSEKGEQVHESLKLLS